MCNDEPDREIKVEFFKSVASGKHKNLGAVCMTLAMLKEGTQSFRMSNIGGEFSL